MRRRGFAIAGLLWCAALAGVPQERVDVRYVVPAVVQRRLEAVPRKPDERRGELESLFREVGCEEGHLSEMRVEHSREPDVVCVLRGGGEGEIVAGGHFDRVAVGRGAVDDWSGVSLLPSLYESLKGKPRRHTYVFVGFASEEVGLVGSRGYVAQLTSQGRAAIRAMVNLECLGMTTPKVWARRADRNLLNLYGQVAGSLGIRVEGVNVDRVGDDDSHPFLNAGIPVITIHSVTSQNLRVLHSSRDNLDAIHPDDYYMAYKLAAVYLTYLDTALP